FPTTGPAFAVLFPIVSMNIASLKAAAKVIKVFILPNFYTLFRHLFFVVFPNQLKARCNLFSKESRRIDYYEKNQIGLHFLY
ncbi:hypothetical protein, partial [Draconibacterium mangrovi]|uniref:hypothetical protein n=1 Tax=Draconibacterium mangrovi TaxID=2697469 RepID=UPI0019542377